MSLTYIGVSSHLHHLPPLAICKPLPPCQVGGAELGEVSFPVHETGRPQCGAPGFVWYDVL
jgi:hypothetical protein